MVRPKRRPPAVAVGNPDFNYIISKCVGTLGRGIKRRERKQLTEAYRIASKHHRHDFRQYTGVSRGGTEYSRGYFFHVVNVAKTVAERGGSIDEITAAFLHDTVEHGHLTIEWIRRKFNNNIAEIVAAVTHPKLKSVRLGVPVWVNSSHSDYNGTADLYDKYKGKIPLLNAMRHMRAHRQISRLYKIKPEIAISAVVVKDADVKDDVVELTNPNIGTVEEKIRRLGKFGSYLSLHNRFHLLQATGRIVGRRLDYSYPAMLGSFIENLSSEFESLPSYQQTQLRKYATRILPGRLLRKAPFLQLPGLTSSGIKATEWVRRRFV